MISLLQLDALLLIALIGVILFSALVHGTLGLGFPLVATPLLATMMDVRSAILVTLLPTMAVNIASIVNSRAALAGTRAFLHRRPGEDHHRQRSQQGPYQVDRS